MSAGIKKGILIAAAILLAIMLATTVACMVRAKQVNAARAAVLEHYSGAGDQYLLSRYYFPWSFFKARAERLSATTKDEIDEIIVGYSRRKEVARPDGSYIIYEFDHMYFWGGVAVSVAFDEEGNLKTFGDMGAEVMLIAPSE